MLKARNVLYADSRYNRSSVDKWFSGAGFIWGNTRGFHDLTNVMTFGPDGGRKLKYIEHECRSFSGREASL